MRLTIRMLLLVLGALLPLNKLSAHEFWISPQAYSVEVGAPILADLRVGQDFNAAAYSYIDFNIARFDLVQNGVVTPVKGRMGDIPALAMAAPGEGLVTIVHETTDSTLNWEEFAKFERFVVHKDLKGTLEAHKAMGLPETGFVETYRRFAKSLVKVGAGAGQDQVVGLRTELVALANPYVDDVSAGLPVLLLYEGKPRVDAQIEVFSKDAAGKVNVEMVRTDGEGKALVPVTSGHEYMLDSVVMLSLGANADPKAPVFQSLWANLTFSVP